MAASGTTPVFWNTKDETVAAPELPAVKLKERTGMRAAEPPPEFGAEETKVPTAGLSEARPICKPVEGAVTEVPVPVPVVVVVVLLLIELTNARVLGPK
jgi:hypothetical protein